MTNDMESTLGKVLNKLTPRLFLIFLIVVILSFVVVILIAINRGAEINFWGFKISPKGQMEHSSAPDVAGGMTAHEFIATLPSDVQGTVEESREKIATAVEERTNLQKINEEKENTFLNRIKRLEAKITQWEGSINTSLKVDEKQDVFRLIQQLLQRIGYYDGPIDADPIRTRVALSNYKQYKGFKDEELWAHVTRQTVIHMVRDYAETLLKESRG